MHQLFLSNPETETFLMLVTTEPLQKTQRKAGVIEVNGTPFLMSSFIDVNEIIHVETGSRFYEFTVSGKGLLRYEEINLPRITFHGEPVKGRVYKRIVSSSIRSERPKI